MSCFLKVHQNEKYQEYHTSKQIKVAKLDKEQIDL